MHSSQTTFIPDFEDRASNCCLLHGVWYPCYVCYGERQRDKERSNMEKNRIRELLGIRYPIVKAPINWVSGTKVV